MITQKRREKKGGEHFKEKKQQKNMKTRERGKEGTTSLFNFTEMFVSRFLNIVFSNLFSSRSNEELRVAHLLSLVAALLLSSRRSFSPSFSEDF